jgi:hypothetical protein
MIDPDRVRFCLSCGQVLPFEQRTCTSCGHFDPTAEKPDEATSTCPACGASKRETLLFCPRCGVDVSLPRAPAPAAWQAPSGGRLEASSIGLALAAPVLALIGLVAAVLRASGA